MSYECYVCKKFIHQGGNCMEYRRNCLAFEEEPRGKRIRQSIAVEIEPEAETEIIKPGGMMVVFNKDTNYRAEAEVCKISYIDFAKWEIGLEADFFEKDLPYLFQENGKRRFKVIQGGKA